MRRKIIHTISNSGTGGGQTHLLELLKHTDRSKFEVLLICDKNGYYITDFKSYADKVYAIDYNKNLILVVLTILRIIRRESPSVIHNHLLRACFLGNLAGLMAGVKSINNLHGDIQDDQNQGQLKKRFYSIVITFLSLRRTSFICVSEFNKRRLVESGISPDKVTVIYNGVRSPDRFQKVRRESLNVVCIARLHPAKGIDTILNAAPYVGDNITVHIVGDGPLDQEYRNFISEHKINNVVLHGFQSDVKPYLQMADIFLLSSNWEGLPIAIVEAMAYKLPVVATNVGGISEIIHDGRGGRLYTPRDSRTLATLINELSLNPQTRLDYGEYNYKFYEQNLTLNKMIGFTEKLYLA